MAMAAMAAMGFHEALSPQVPRLELTAVTRFWLKLLISRTAVIFTAWGSVDIGPWNWQPVPSLLFLQFWVSATSRLDIKFEVSSKKKNHHHHHQHLWSKVEQHFVQDVRLWRQIKPATKGDLNLEGMATRLGPSATPGLLRMMSVMWVTCHYPLVISNITMENHHF